MVICMTNKIQCKEDSFNKYKWIVKAQEGFSGGAKYPNDSDVISDACVT